eukprot:12941279-Ditylum_brightwellii.AAC.1
MKQNANRYFGNSATTDDVPASTAMNILDITPNTNNDYKSIFYNRKEEFTWTKTDRTEVFDGPTLIWVILTALKPTRNVDIQAEVKVIELAKLSGYGNDPLKMLDSMELRFNQIRDLSGKTVFITKQFTIQVF